MGAELASRRHERVATRDQCNPSRRDLRRLVQLRRRSWPCPFRSQPESFGRESAFMALAVPNTVVWMASALAWLIGEYPIAGNLLPRRRRACLSIKSLAQYERDVLGCARSRGIRLYGLDAACRGTNRSKNKNSCKTTHVLCLLRSCIADPNGATLSFGDLLQLDRSRAS